MSKSRAEAAAGAPGIVLRYLQEQNRPYSAQDVFGNLQKEHGLGKAAVVKALDQLAQQGKIKEKTYGKQKIYFADQDQFETVNDGDLHSLDDNIVALTAKVQSLQQSCRHMEAGKAGHSFQGAMVWRSQRCAGLATARVYKSARKATCFPCHCMSTLCVLFPHLFCCFVLQDRIALCSLGCAGLTEICLPNCWGFRAEGINKCTDHS
ncbi:homologous-pairing protein 2 homolog isoform X3 [Psammomys obesus]|uniref:homologous-pairing protein 2 homolog isoform X3 n=1 Tax=Psammomys obesus TaxID=48139 RepID=UPI002452A40D|nr:homologous-pairing protein 2 homolog isoform X3 [Psammomys obesus]